MATKRTYAELKEIHARYNRSEKGKARQRKMYRTDKGQQVFLARRRKRLYAGKRYCGIADTPEQAAAINAHIKERLSEFVQGQSSRAQAEGVATGAVQTQTEL